jgi:hypothetical protein
MEMHSIAQARRYGTIVTVVAIAGALLFAIGVSRRSYTALAVPVGVVVLGGLGVAAWLGRLLMTTPDPPSAF